jgi:hypothetical protein
MCYFAHMQHRDMFRKTSCDKKKTTYSVSSLDDLLTTPLFKARPVAGYSFSHGRNGQLQKMHLSALPCLSVTQSVR